MSSSKPPEVFVSYSHLDDEYKDGLVKQLNVLAEQGIISQWHDGLLRAGERWNEEIVKRLNSSRVILLLISVDFLNSVYINGVEIKHASRRYQAGEVTVIPVLVRNVYGWKKKPFGDIKLGDLQALPSNAKFIKSWRDRDDAFANIAEGIQKAVENLKPSSPMRVAPPPAVPTSHPTDYVKRHDEKGRDILERLKEELAAGKTGLVALWGKGGTGKTRIAAEAASALTADFAQRIVWASAEKRTDFTFSTLVDEIARQLGELGLLKLAPGPKEEAVRVLLAQAPALIVLDNFETIASVDERASCVDFLAERANCPSLITSRVKIAAPARNIPIKGMSNQEAQELLDQLIEQTQESRIFTEQVVSRIIKTAESNPYIMLWMVAQIDEAQTPKKVLDELEQGKGEVAERVFERSFTLPQVGEDGRAALLALTLFVPDASRDALAEVAGFGGDMARMNEAAKNLRMLWLISASEENERLAVEGLTRSLATARLSKDDRVNEFRQRFVKHFLSYAQDHSQPTPDDYDSLEADKDNLIAATEAAMSLDDWRNAQRLVRIVANPVTGVMAVRGFWDETAALNERALEASHCFGSESDQAAFAHNLAVIRMNRGELDEARQLLHGTLEISRRLGDQGSFAMSLHQLAVLAQYRGELFEARRLYNESLGISKKLDDQIGIAIGLHELGRLAQSQGELEEARRLYDESLEISKSLGDQSRIAGTTSQLGIVHFELGERAESKAKHDESLAIRRKLGDQGGIAIDLHQLASLAQDRGELDEARRLYYESLEIEKKLGNQSGIARTTSQLGILHLLRGEKAESKAKHDESLAIRRKLEDQMGIAIDLHQLGMLAEDEGDNVEAEQLFGQALVIFDKLKSPNAKVARQSLERLKSTES